MTKNLFCKIALMTKMEDFFLFKRRNTFFSSFIQSNADLEMPRILCICLNLCLLLAATLNSNIHAVFHSKYLQSNKERNVF